MQLPISYSSKDIIARLRASVSFVEIVRWGFVVIAFFSLGTLALDVFIFYRYSYRVVNLRPDPVAQVVRIDREGLRGALIVLDVRAEKFKALYEGGTTTPR